MKIKFDLKKLALAAVLCALALGSMFVFRIKVQFLTFDAKDSVIALCSLLLGPLYGVCSAAAVAVLELFTTGSDTGFYGLIMNFLSSGTFALTCGIIYKYRRTFGGAVLAVIMSVISVTTVMLLANLFITPLFMHAPRSAVVAILPTLILPFNLTKSSLNAAITLMVYKPLSAALKRAGLTPSSGDAKYRFGLRSVIVTVCAVLVIIAAVLVLILCMGGSFKFFNAK
ncbi:MAG: ECF transporter S component [Clostridia bacterium]|nr:ECF transporter S component [Clostridia bacterium]